MPWRRSLVAFLGLSVCAVGCASAPPAEIETRAVVVIPSEEPAHMMSVAETPTGPAVTTDDVIDWTARGVGDSMIITRIHQTRSVFHLSAEQECKLRAAGVSDSVVKVMDATTWD